MAQEIISGKIIDSSSKEPLPFVTILYQSNPSRGVISDINGHFIIKKNQEVKALTVSFIGYSTKTVQIDSLSFDLNKLIIEIDPMSFELGEIVVVPGENPAHRIIKKVIENKPANNPEKLSSYSCNIYNKLLVEPRMSPHSSAKDSASFYALQAKLKGSGIVIIESVSNRIFLRPDRIVDSIIASNVSGFKDPSFTFLGTWFQPFAFYDEMIELGTVSYLNPISQKSYRNYHFSLKDTIINEEDTTYIISFFPFPGKNFDGLTGQLFINTHNFAIQNVIAEPYSNGLISFKIQQKYQLIDNNQWFPEQLLFEMRLTNQPFAYFGNSYMRDVKINPDISPSEVGVETVHINNLAGEKDSVFWQKARAVPLSAKERLTYHRIDSIGREMDFDSKLKLVEDLAFGEAPVGAILGESPLSVFNVVLNKVYYTNRAEGIRLGLGLKTNNRVSKRFSAGGYFGYGFHDKLWKYGSDLKLTLSEENETRLLLSYQNTVMEPGSSDLGKSVTETPGILWQNYAVTRNDKVLEYKAEFASRLFKYAVFSLAFKHQERNPLYEYSFVNESPGQVKSYNSLDLFIKYSYAEKVEKLFTRRVSSGTKYPVVYMAYSKGISGLTGGDFSFNRIEFGVYKSFQIRKIGESEIRAEVGYVDKDVPSFLMFSAEGSKGSSGIFALRNTFQTMHRNEFLSDEYLNIYYSHNFGSILFRTKNFNPRLSVFQNIGYGRLHHPEYQNLLDFKTKEKGFYETGLGLNNLVKINVKNVVYFGFGAEVFNRFGSYSYSLPIDNMSIKLTFTSTFY
jgi:hypothetical protein